MQCPYKESCHCEDEMEWEELNVHILREHPEKGHSAEAFAQAMSRASRINNIVSIAGILAAAAARGPMSPEDIWGNFRYFYLKLDENLP